MSKMSKWLIALAGGILLMFAGCSAPPPAAAPDTSAKDTEDIKALESRFAAAVKAKDVNAIMAVYVPDQSLVVFDIVPPRQYVGAEAYRKDWEALLGMFPGPLEFSISDLDVTVGGNVAFGHSIQALSLTDKNGKKLEMNGRVTDGYKKVNGQWLIAHEHVSVPLDLETMKPDLTSKP